MLYKKDKFEVGKQILKSKESIIKTEKYMSINKKHTSIMILIINQNIILNLTS